MNNQPLQQHTPEEQKYFFGLVDLMWHYQRKLKATQELIAGKPAEWDGSEEGLAAYEEERKFETLSNALREARRAVEEYYV